MAFTSGFFDAELIGGAYDRVYSAEAFAEYFSTFIANGVFPTPATNLQVSANAVNDMNVLVGAGMGWVNGYWCKNSGPYPIAIQAASGTLNRIDIIVFGWNKTTRAISSYVKTGTASASPTAPDLVRNADLYELMLASVTVTAGATKITQANITDKRADKAVCGWVSGVVDQIDATNLFAQYDMEFKTWFKDIQDQLSGDVATNLQNQINALKTDKVAIVNKATKAEAEAGIDDTKWMTPIHTKQTVSKLGMKCADSLGRVGIFSPRNILEPIREIFPCSPQDALLGMGSWSYPYATQGHIIIIGDCIGTCDGGLNTQHSIYLKVYNIKTGIEVISVDVSNGGKAHNSGWVGVSPAGNFLACTSAATFEVAVDGTIVNSITYTSNDASKFASRCIPLDVNRVISISTESSVYYFGLLVNGQVRNSRYATMGGPDYHIGYHWDGTYLTMMYSNIDGRMALGKLLIGTTSNALGVSIYQECLLSNEVWGRIDRSAFCLFDGSYAYCWASNSTNNVYRFFKKVLLSSMTVYQTCAIPNIEFFNGSLGAAFWDDGTYIYIVGDTSTSGNPNWYIKVQKSNMSLIEQGSSIAGLSVTNLMTQACGYVYKGNGAVNGTGTCYDSASKCLFTGKRVVDLANSKAYNVSTTASALYYKAPNLVAWNNQTLYCFNTSVRELIGMVLAAEFYPWGV